VNSCVNFFEIKNFLFFIKIFLVFKALKIQYTGSTEFGNTSRSAGGAT